jgi:FHA domain
VSQGESPRAEDAFNLAAQLPRNMFVAQFPEPILVVDGAFSATGSSKAKVPSSLFWETTKVGKQTPKRVKMPMASVVRKVRPNYPRMITVGRTPHNDVVIPDNTVSKLHAFFRHLGDGQALALSDNGSRNGTFINEQRLTPHGAMVVVPLGARIRFADVSLTLITSGDLWDEVHQRAEAGGTGGSILVGGK